VVGAFLATAAVHAQGETIADECRAAVFSELQEERRAYRAVQFAADQRSVLGVETANTSDLVPYLVLNYHALDCRLRMLCDAAEQSHGHLNEGRCTDDPKQWCDEDSDCAAGSCILKLAQPLGCSRLFAARGRWWSSERRDQTFKTAPVAACAYSAQEDAVPVPFFIVTNECRKMAEQILDEERQMLRLLVSQDGAHRGTRRVIGVFQSVLFDLRDSFLEPLRGMADLFGSVLHPIPCLLAHCQ
jgi:hypothetical protein